MEYKERGAQSALMRIGLAMRMRGLDAWDSWDVNWIYNYCKQKIVIQSETQHNCTEDKKNGEEDAKNRKNKLSCNGDNKLRVSLQK